MKASLFTSKTAQHARLGLVENNYQHIKDQVDTLAVKATTNGLVQVVVSA
ncbi:MAG: hypothetical protein QMC62_10490 [Alteromonadaceae bacterium]|jgi:HlyD family secretion protein